MTNITEHMALWGVPEEYRRNYSRPGDNRRGEEVSIAANWYSEMDAALEEMIRRGDHGAILEWAQSDVWAVGSALWSDLAANDWAGDYEDYCNGVTSAMRRLAAAVKKGEEDD